jgi:threonine dehydratase
VSGRRKTPARTAGAASARRLSRWLEDEAATDLDISLERIEGAADTIDAVFLNSPQFVADGLSAELGREVLVKVETVNPIGSFKGRGTSLLAHTLDPSRTWVCATAGNFGQGVAYAARARGAQVHVFAAAGAPHAKVERMRAFGAHVETSERSVSAAHEFAAAGANRTLVVDGLDPAIAEGAATIGVELDAAGAFDTVVVQMGDGALLSGIARWLKATQPGIRVVGVCASGAPAMARSIAAGRPVSVQGAGTIATALEITDPVPESLARVSALVDDVVLVDDGDLRAAMDAVAGHLGLLVEPAGAAGIAALARHRAAIDGERVAVILTGAGTLRAVLDQSEGRNR